MKRLALLLPFLVFALPIFNAAPVDAQTGEILIAQREWDDDEDGEEQLEKKEINTDVNIKGIDPKNLLFNTPVSTTNSPLTTVLYDRAVEGDMCFISCNFYNGVTSKWSDFFVDLQPFENFCMTFTGCASQYPTPSEVVLLKIGSSSYSLKMSDLTQNRYYIPLLARKDISRSSGEVSVEIQGVKMPVYKIGPENREILRKLVNQSQELTKYVDVEKSRTLKEKLLEAKDLLDSGLITEAEYQDRRLKILNSDN
jgi:hypothetical protein